MYVNSLQDDLDHIIAHTKNLWDELRGRRIFITGGTGFFGCWLLESFMQANSQLNLNATAVVLTRNSDVFRRKAPHIANYPAIQFHIGDIQNFNFPEGHFSHMIHAATEASTTINSKNPLQMIDTIVAGTRHSLEFARQNGVEKFLFISSGAVYGRQPMDISHISEDYQGASDPSQPQSAYGEGKRLAELLCSIYAQQFGLDAKIARCFTFIGPYLPLDKHFAIGNFIQDALSGGPIKIKGDGTPLRSYLYTADLAIVLWTVLFNGEYGPYNVGSENAISIADLAHIIAQRFQPPLVVEFGKVAMTAQNINHYVPSTTRVRMMLGLDQKICLQEAIQRTVTWYS